MSLVNEFKFKAWKKNLEFKIQTQIVHMKKFLEFNEVIKQNLKNESILRYFIDV